MSIQATDHPPLAVRLGCTHVSARPVAGGWTALQWAPASGPCTMSPVTDYETAVDYARGLAATLSNAVLDLPDGMGVFKGRGRIDITRRDDELEVVHWSPSKSSFALLRCFALDDRKRAILFALGSLSNYTTPEGASRLGRIAR